MQYQDLPQPVGEYVSLTTDFGLEGDSVGAVKGVIRNVLAAKGKKEVIIEDFCHSVSPFNVREGAWVLWAGLGYLPIGVHLAVVDPGVGTERKPLAIKMTRYQSDGSPYQQPDYLIGPDNGLLVPATKRGRVERIVEIDPEIGLKPTSSIFHGRDIFAPAAAELASGTPLEEIATSSLSLEDLSPSPYGEARKEGGKLIGEVIRRDGYGNVFTTIPLEWAEQKIGYGNLAKVILDDKEHEMVLQYAFGKVKKGEFVLTDNAYGQVQVSVNQGNAAERMEIGLDNKVTVTIEKA